MALTAAQTLTLSGLAPAPEEQWAELRAFVALNQDDLAAMRTTLEVLLRSAPALVRDNYDYLRRFPGTAAVLGWESGFGPAHLEERRRFMTLWLGRVLGLDLSDDFARYMYRAGQVHAGHGPRQIHVPPIYVSGGISLAHAAFAERIAAECADVRQVGAALAGWHKYLTMQLHMMLLGYAAGMARDQGAITVPVVLLGRLRHRLGAGEVPVRVPAGAPAADVVRRFFGCHPELRADVFTPVWAERESRSNWMHVERAYELRPHWHIWLSGHDLRFHPAGLHAPVAAGDHITISPPAR